MDRGVAVVTGASSGIGAATAHSLAREGFRVVLGARRVDRLATIASEIGDSARFAELDVTDPYSIAAFCAEVDECNVLVNNAGGALGLENIAVADEERWLEMYQMNVMSVVRMTKSLLPKLVASGNGHVISIGSVAGIEPYQGGGGYVAAKTAERALMHVLRLEVNGMPVRVSQVDPGMVETEFSVVRFDGDEARAAAVYQNMTPLVAEDIAECITFIATRPSHVDIDELVVRPRDQARTWLVHRESNP